MFDKFQQLPAMYQGMLYFVAGLIILLYALGIVEKGITIIVVVLALYLITVGAMKVGLYQKICAMFMHVKKDTKE